jgi:Tol biopolymer transport system component
VPGEGYSVGAFSPDGRMIAFTSTRSGSRNVWMKPVGSGEAVQVTKDEFRNENPIWSPNGEELAFFSLRGNQLGIWRIPYTGGTPTLIKTFPESVRLKSWSKDGATIYYETQQRLFALDVQTKQTAQLTDVDAVKTKAESFSIAPDGERVAYVRVGADGRSTVWIAPARGGASTQLASHAGHARNTVWHPDGEKVLYSVNVDGIYQIFGAYVDGQPPAQLTFGEANSFALDVSADGGKILYGSSKEESDIWGVRVDNGEEFALTSDIGSEFWPTVSPDGQMIMFQSVRNLSQGDKIFNCSLLTRPVNADGQQFELVTNAFLPQWSPDGRQLAFMRRAGRRLSLWSISATGGAERQLTPDELPPLVETTLLPYHRVQSSYYSWAPDSSRLAYCANDGGQHNFWIVSADGAHNTQVTSNNDPNRRLYCPLWSADGKRLAYSSKPDRAADGEMSYSVWITDVETKDSKAIFQSNSFLRLLSWSAGEPGLLLATFKGKTASGALTEVGLLRIAADTGAQQPLATLPSTYLYNIHLSADRQMIAFTSNRDGKDNIWVMPANGGAAKRLTTNNDARLYFSTLSWSPDGKAIYFGKQSRHSLLSMIINPK